MKKLSLIKNLALTAALLGSTQLYAAVPSTQQQPDNSTLTEAQKKELIGLQEKLKRGDFNSQQQAAVNQEKSARQRSSASAAREQLRMTMEGQPSQSSRAGYSYSVPNPTTLYDLQKALMMVRGNEKLINRILEAYIKSGTQLPNKLNLDGLGLRAVPYALRHPLYATNLTELKMTQNRLQSLEGIEHLKNLKMLAVGLNQLTDISALQGLPNLTFFSAVGNRLTTESLAINLPATLQTLVLDGNRINSLPQNRLVDGLRSISLQGNPLTHFCWINSTRYLQSLRVDSATFQQVLAQANAQTGPDQYCVALAQSKMPKV